MTSSMPSFMCRSGMTCEKSCIQVRSRPDVEERPGQERHRQHDEVRQRGRRLLGLGDRADQQPRPRGTRASRPARPGAPATSSPTAAGRTVGSSATRTKTVACPTATSRLRPTRAASTVHTGVGESRTRRSTCLRRHTTSVSPAPNAADVATPQDMIPGVMNWIGCSEVGLDLLDVERVLGWLAGRGLVGLADHRADDAPDRARPDLIGGRVVKRDVGPRPD